MLSRTEFEFWVVEVFSKYFDQWRACSGQQRTVEEARRIKARWVSAEPDNEFRVVRHYYLKSTEVIGDDD